MTDKNGDEVKKKCRGCIHYDGFECDLLGEINKDTRQMCGKLGYSDYYRRHARRYTDHARYYLDWTGQGER